jgi:hypothetical protein
MSKLTGIQHPCPCNNCTYHPCGPLPQMKGTIQNHLKAQSRPQYHPTRCLQHQPASSPISSPPLSPLPQRLDLDIDITNINHHEDLQSLDFDFESLPNLGCELPSMQAGSDPLTSDQLSRSSDNYSEPPAPWCESSWLNLLGEK